MNKTLFLIFFVIQSFVSLSQSITNITVSQRQDGSGKVDVNYTLSGSADAYNISAEVSLNNGATWQAIYNLSGNVINVSPGNRQLIWNAGAEMPGVYVSNARIKLTATEAGGGTGQPCPGVPTVNYDGQTYNTVYIGNQCWLKENLNIGTMIPGVTNQSNNDFIEKYCYNNTPADCATYGGLYQWDEAMQYVTTQGAQGICPGGWHIPTDGEWTSLTNYASGESIAGGKLKSTRTVPDPHPRWDSPNTGAVDEYGFSILPSGDLKAMDGNFFNQGSYAFMWTSTEYSYIYAWHRIFKYNSNSIERIYYSALHDSKKANGFSVRCLKN